MSTKRMGLVGAVLILFLLGFNSVVNLKVSRKSDENEESRSFITFKTNLINQKACNCSTPTSCACCESVKIFYTSEDKQLCFNIIYRNNGLNFDLTLDSLMIKSMTVANYKPFRMCSWSVPGLFFTTICVQILELNQFERSITVCPRVEVISAKERWQINYICNSISTAMSAAAPARPMTMTMAMMPVMQMMPMAPAMAAMPAGQMMPAPAGQVVMGQTSASKGKKPASPAPMGQTSESMGQKPASPSPMGQTSASMGQKPASPAPMGQTSTPMGQKPAAPVPMGQTSAPMGQKPVSPASMVQTSAPMGQKPASPAPMGQAPPGTTIGQMPPTPPMGPAGMPMPPLMITPRNTTPAPMISMPEPPPSGQMPPSMTMIQMPPMTGMNPAAMIIISGVPSIPGQTRPAASANAATPAPQSAMIMPRPASNAMLLILRPMARSKLIFEPDEFEVGTRGNRTEAKQESDVVASLLAANEKSTEKVTNFNVQESLTYSIKSDSVSKSIDETLQNQSTKIQTNTTINDGKSKNLRRRKRQSYDIFEAYHQSDRCERAYKICVTKSKNYIVSRLRSPKNKNKCLNKPARIIFGSEDKLCLDSNSSGSFTTSRPAENQFAPNQENDSLDAIIIHDESTENYNFNSQKLPFKVTLNPSGRPSIFPLRTPPLIALQMKDAIRKIANDSSLEIDAY